MSKALVQAPTGPHGGRHATPQHPHEKIKLNFLDENDPKLLILLPTKSLVREEAEDYEDYIEMEDSWMELSCKVLGAKLVDGVDFMA